MAASRMLHTRKLKVLHKTEEKMNNPLIEGPSSQFVRAISPFDSPFWIIGSEEAVVVEINPPPPRPAALFFVYVQ